MNKTFICGGTVCCVVVLWVLVQVYCLLFMAECSARCYTLSDGENVAMKTR
jgi:hypothetical protein